MILLFSAVLREGRYEWLVWSIQLMSSSGGRARETGARENSGREAGEERGEAGVLRRQESFIKSSVLF